MNIANIIDQIEKVDGEIYMRISPRRKAMKDLLRVGSKVAMAAAPLVAASMFKKAYGQTVPDEVVRVLQFALKLEHLEYNFYNQGLTSAPIPAGAERVAIETIRDSEKKHVDYLVKLITDIKKVPEPELTTYDFTGGAVFTNVFSDYTTFLQLPRCWKMQVSGHIKAGCLN